MIGDKIKERRIELGLTQAQLSNETGIKSTTISNYENNISSPSEENIFKFMEVLKCDANYLFEWEEVKDIQLSFFEKKHIKKYRILDEYGKKVIDSTLDIEYDRCTSVNNDEEETEEPKIQINYSYIPASAGSGSFLDEQNMEIREYPNTPESRQADIVIPVDGDSMEPMFHDGDELYVRLQPAVEEGEIGIFEQGDKAFVKKYAKDRLISLNPDYDDIFPSGYDDTKCIGKVIGRV